MRRESHAGLAVTAAALAALVAFRGRRQRSLQEGIADFYDASTGALQAFNEFLGGVWVEIWGDHLHHGYYEDNSWR